jgi:acetate kinase
LAVLALNPGSSTLKYALFDGDRETRRSVVEVAEAKTMTAAATRVIESVSGGQAPSPALASGQAGAPVLHAVGVRVVHGGSRFVEPALVDEAVLDDIAALTPLAPLHNPLALEVIHETRRLLPDVPVVAVFDTAFHRTLPPVASTYAIPHNLALRRYGFHGISHSYVSSRLKKPRLVSCHLGNGASVCAIRDGVSIDTSMGLTPMEGLVMGTRSGDIDPGLILFLLRGGMSEHEIDDVLNHRSGLLGVGGHSDVRELEAAGGERAELALEIFGYRVARYIGAYAAALEGLDALVFTGGIGEHSPSMRTRMCKRLGFLGVALDEARNQSAKGTEARINSGAVEVWVIPTDEELEIARATESLLSRSTSSSS